ncbi:MAG: SIMPL domain-containing protein [Gemmobacter sp.]|nr:SIMPL domain-containing protein [Gemmobacter sp.]
MRLKTAKVLAVLLAAHLVVVPALAETPDRRISVTGEGRVDAAPDMATITLGVQTQAATAAEALAANTARLAAVLERLKAAGIAERDLQTSGLSLGPQMEYPREGQPPRLVGYEVSNMLTVRVRDLARLGAVLDQAVSDGANTFHGLNFGLSETGAALDAARVKAVQDARRKAEMMAGAAGVKLGAVQEITEAGNMVDPRPMYRMGAAMDSAAVPVQGGEVSYTVNVTVTWTLAAE